MKKLNLAVAFALSLAVPFGAMAASDDATIRAMGMSDNAAAAVMKDIGISDDNANYRAVLQVAKAELNRNRDRAREHMELEHENETPVPVPVPVPVVEESPTPPPMVMPM